MRKLIVCNIMSLDGYFEGPGGNVMALPMDGFFDELHLMVGAAVLGGGTPAFGAGVVPRLRLVSTRRRDGSDNLLLQYEVVSRDA